MKLLDDKSNVHDQDIRNNSLIHYKLKKGSTMIINYSIGRLVRISGTGNMIKQYNLIFISDIMYRKIKISIIDQKKIA